MKRILSVLMVLLLSAITLIPCAGVADGYTGTGPYLVSLKHNCTNTGKMLPEAFDPNTTAYILTVGCNVSRVKFTPVANDPQCTVTVNGVYVAQGTESQIIQMDDNPKQAFITVTAPDGASRTYTIFLQRRPSDKKSLSAGYINEIYVKDNKWYIDADLVSLTYHGGNLSTFTNRKQEHYKYECVDECALYVGDRDYAIRVRNMNEFMMHYDHTGMYKIIYCNDKIVAVFPYAADEGD